MEKLDIYFEPTKPDKIISLEFIFFLAALFITINLAAFAGWAEIKSKQIEIEFESNLLKYETKGKINLLESYNRQIENKENSEEYEELIPDKNTLENIEQMESYFTDEIIIEKFEYSVEENILDITGIFYSRMEVVEFGSSLSKQDFVYKVDYDEITNLADNRVQTDIHINFYREDMEEETPSGPQYEGLVE